MSAIHSLAEEICKASEKETIHNFRVSIKSLRALLRLLNYQHPEYKVKLSKRLKTLYHIAGNIRDAQLQLEYIAMQQYDLPLYRAKLQQTIDEYTREWSKAYSKKVFHNLEKRLLKNQYHPLHKDDVQTFIDANFSSIVLPEKGILFTSKNIHDVRKHLKDIQYVIRTIREKAISVLPGKLQPENLDELTSAIGKYLDERLMYRDLNAFARSLAQCEEKTMITEMNKKEKVKLRKHRKNIIDTLNNLTVQLSYSATPSCV